MLKISSTLTEQQRSELNVLNDGERRIDRTWAECVKEARSLLKMSDEIRFKIIALANKCCSDIQGSKYTYGRFADEIGLGRTTLYEWVRVKKDVYDVLPKEDQTFLTFTQMKELNSRTVGLPSGSQEKGKAVLRSLKQMKKESPDTLKFRRYLEQLNHVLYNVKDKHRTKDCDRGVLAEILHVSREISKNLSWVDFEEKRK